MNKRILCTSILLVSSLCVAEVPTLDGFNAHAAFIAPISIYEGKMYLILGRETAGKDAGTFDAFGGKTDLSDGKDPLNTAAREFFEEGITAKTLSMSNQQVRSYIDLSLDNTKHVFAVNDRYRNVLVIAEFTTQAIDVFLGLFAAAYKNAPSGHGHHEKDAIATAKLEEVFEAMRTASSSKSVYVNAEVTDLAGQKQHQLIHIRPVLVKCLRGYVDNALFTQGVDPRIRFYPPVGSHARKSPRKPCD